MNVTIFKNLGDINSPYTITLEDALDRIRTGQSRQKIEEIREALFLGQDISVLKKDLPFVVFSAAKTEAVTSKKGHQTHREDASVVEHSGLFVLDFDNCNVELKKEQLRRDPYIYAIWTGPSGTGVKALVRCPPNIQQHNLYYTAFLSRYDDLDKTSRNIARGTFEGYDPELWVNENSLIWDKRMSEEERRKIQEKDTNRRGTKIKATAVAMVRSAVDGEKHDTLRNAAVLLGGAVAIGRVEEEDAIKLLEEEIQHKNIKDLSGAKQTIRDGLAFGKSRPLAEIKKLEKSQQYLRRTDGSYDFEADIQETDEYLLAVINGTLAQGLPTGMNSLNQNFLFKKNHLVIWAALDNVGKSFFVWFLAICASRLHNWKCIINSNENSDGELFKKLIEFFLNKSIKLADDEEITIARDFVREHFRIISSKNLHSIEEFLFKCEIMIDEGFEANVIIADPYNSYDVKVDANMYMNTMHSLNLMRIFKENYCSVWLVDHIGTAAARKKDKEGFVEVPWKSDIDQGQLKANKADDFVILHRVINDQLRRNDLQVHITKIKSIETGGFPTDKDNPVIIEINKDYCGYSANGQDPMKEFNEKKK